MPCASSPCRRPPTARSRGRSPAPSPRPSRRSSPRRVSRTLSRSPRQFDFAANRGMETASPAGEATRLYAATGDGIARLTEGGGEWTVELSLRGSGAQCLAVDPRDPDTVYAGLREGGVHRTTDGGRTWSDCGLPERAPEGERARNQPRRPSGTGAAGSEPGVFSLAVSAADGAVYAGTEPSRLYRSDDRGESWRELEALLELPSRPT